MIKIYTSYFGMVKKMRAAGIVPIGIAISPPKWFDGPNIKDVAPRYEMLKWGNKRYDAEFINILAKNDPKQFVEELEILGGGADVAICCYEKPEDRCHRHSVSWWLNKHLGIDIREWSTNIPIYFNLDKGDYDGGQ